MLAARVPAVAFLVACAAAGAASCAQGGKAGDVGPAAGGGGAGPGGAAGADAGDAGGGPAGSAGDAAPDKAPDGDAAGDKDAPDAPPDGPPGDAACEAGKKACGSVCVAPDDPAYGCGTCAPCAPAHAKPACGDAGCAIASCDAGWADCNGAVADGCEVATATDLSHCGGCGAACSGANATPTCNGGVCKIVCKQGFADCDQKTATGCETDTSSDPANCGQCSLPCGSFPNGTAICTSGACGLKCNTGFGNCDGNSTNGCETPTDADPANCGACGTKCACGQPCAGGSCVVTQAPSVVLVASSQAYPGDPSPTGIAVDATSIYWVAGYDKGKVIKVDKSGGTPVALASGTTYFRGLAVDASWVYFGQSSPAALARVDKGGGSPVSIDTGYSPHSIVSDGAWVYYTSGSFVRKALPAGGSATSLATGQDGARGIAVDSEAAVWANFAAGTVVRAEKNGAWVQTLASGEPGPQGVATDGTWVWFTAGTSQDGVVRKVSVNGGAVTTVASGCTPFAVAADATSVFWTNYSSTTVMKVDKGGGKPAAVTAGQAQPFALTLDATSVYWTTDGPSGTVKKAPK